MLEQLGDQCLSKLVLVEYDERVPFVRPPYEIGVLLLLEKAGVPLSVAFFTACITAASAYLLSFCMKGGIGFLLDWAALFAICACSSRRSMLSLSSSAPFGAAWTSAPSSP